MKLVLVTNYPLADNADWKKELFINLTRAGHQLDVVYGRKRPIDHLKAYLRKRMLGNDMSRAAGSKERNVLFFRKRQTLLKQFTSINSDSCIEFLKNGQYDFILTALDQILLKKFTSTFNNILNVHYGLLPNIKGTSATEWTFYNCKEVFITLHYINRGIDTGRIIHREKINTSACNNFNDIRIELQKHISGIYLNFIEGNYNNDMENKGGKIFTYMHPELKSLLENAINQK